MCLGGIWRYGKGVFGSMFINKCVRDILDVVCSLKEGDKDNIPCLDMYTCVIVVCIRCRGL